MTFNVFCELLHKFSQTLKPGVESNCSNKIRGLLFQDVRKMLQVMCARVNIQM